MVKAGKAGAVVAVVVAGIAANLVAETALGTGVEVAACVETAGTVKTAGLVVVAEEAETVVTAAGGVAVVVVVVVAAAGFEVEAGEAESRTWFPGATLARAARRGRGNSAGQVAK